VRIVRNVYPAGRAAALGVFCRGLRYVLYNTHHHDKGRVCRAFNSRGGVLPFYREDAEGCRPALFFAVFLLFALVRLCAPVRGGRVRHGEYGIFDAIRPLAGRIILCGGSGIVLFR
jgi:hypothetical protein